MAERIIAVIGASNADELTLRLAEEIGRLIARKGCMLLCGGLGGVMQAAARGASAEGGITIGVLPQRDKDEANPFIRIPIATGFGEGRNVILVRTADALIAVGGEYGTLSEIAFGLKIGKPVIGLATWDVEGMRIANGPEDAVQKAIDALRQRGSF